MKDYNMFDRKAAKNPNEIYLEPSMLYVPGHANDPVLEQLLRLVQLLEKKYLKVNASGIYDITNPNQVSVILLNGRHGINQGIDEENAHPINFLAAFNATVKQEEGAYPYCSNSVITFDHARLKDILPGIEQLPTPHANDNRGKLMAKC